MTHEFLSVIGGSPADAEPGIQTVNGTGFNPNFFPIATGYPQENTAANANWFPFDRMIQVPTPSFWDNGISAQYGTYIWQRNQILRLNGTTNNWVDILTIANQQNVWDYGIHTGLYEVYGSDGKLYVCGIYPGTTGATYVGAVKFDTETETWTDVGQQNVGSRFTNCQYALAWNEKLWLVTENKLFSFDPVGETLTYEAVSGDGRPDQKPLVLGQRFFICTEFSSRLKIWEKIAGTWTEVADLGQITHNANAMFDYVLTNTQAIFFFNSVEGGSSGYRAVEVTTVDPEPGGVIIIDDATPAVLIDSPFIFDPALNSNPDVRFWTASDSSAFPDQAPQVNLYFQETVTGFGEPWKTNRWIDKNSSLGGLGNAFGGGNSYMSCKEGSGGRLFAAPYLPTVQRKIVVYKVEPADLVVEDGLLISFWAFGDVGTGQVKIRINYPISPVSSVIRAYRATIYAVISGGTLFNFTLINNVPINKTGGGVHQFVWDRNTDAYKSWLVYALSVDLSD